MLIEITNRERINWQLRSVRVLAALLRQAGKAELPPIAWTVGNAGASLVGRCYGSGAERRRAEFTAWARAIDATDRREHTDNGGTVHLFARVKGDDGMVDVAVLADVFPDD